MSRYIDADALMETIGIKGECVCCEYADEIFYCKQGSAFVDACEAINDAPTIEIIRCRECRDFVYDDWYKCYGCASDKGLMGEVKPDDFCSYGERRK